MNIFIQRGIALWALLLPLCGQCVSQAKGGPDLTSTRGYSAAAEEAADQLVSLSADKIVTFLRDEPGLLLQVKRALVKIAYDQGRVLKADDLTDEALFKLIRTDQDARVLATREIENRSYVKAKPDRLEAQQELASRERRRAEMQNSPPPQNNEGYVRQTQEEQYWSGQDQQVRQDSGTEQVGPPQPSIPQPGQAVPRIPRSNGPLVERTEVDQFTQRPGSENGMPTLRPDELPALLSASARQSSPSAGNRIPDPQRNDLKREYADAPTMSSSSAIPFPRVGDSNIRYRAPTISAQDQVSDPSGAHRRTNPYANVPALYDLYAQYSKRPSQLERFGLQVFRNGSGNVNELPMDMPVGPDYVVGPGDGLTVEIWGGVSEHLQRLVDREGRIALPEVGSVEVSGRSLGEVQHLLQSALRTEFRDVEADVSISRLRTVRVYVVGDVNRPGAYDVSSLSTPLNALYVAGGPTANGSLRTVKHYRGKQLIEEVDVYDLLLHGIRGSLERLQAGDTLLVPPLGPLVTLEGMVRRPAIYELNGEKNLSEVLALAGGVLPTGTLREIQVERLEAHDHRTMLRLDLAASDSPDAITQGLDAFKVADNDTIRISPILPYAEKTVFLDGHVFRPGKYAYREGMNVTDVVKSYRDILPEPYKRHAEIIRLQPPDYSPVVMAFNLDDAFAGKVQGLGLEPFDTIRIFSRYDFEDPPVITVTGEVREPGDHITNGGTYVRDAIFLAGGATPDALLGDAQVFRRVSEGRLKVISINLGKALDGSEADNILLQPKDRILVHRASGKADPAVVVIEGEVLHPGRYALGSGMSAAELVRLAGGFKRSAYTREADLTHYSMEEDKKIIGEHVTVPIGDALAGVADSDARLHDGDVLTIRQIAGWNDLGATITVGGEVVHPGTYGVQEGERLSAVLLRAGGLRSDAYPYGAILGRSQIEQLEEQQRAELIRRLQEQGSALKLLPESDEDQRSAKEASLAQWKASLERLENTPSQGRQVIHIGGDIHRWANTSADVQVRAGDSIFIPKTPNFVMVNGAVYNPTAVTHKPGKNAEWYLNQAGGTDSTANKNGIFVVRADGSVVGRSGSLFSGGAKDVELRPGDMVVVPEKAYSGTTRWKNTLQAAQLVSAIGIAIQVARGF